MISPSKVYIGEFLYEPRNLAKSVAFSPDGVYALSGHGDGTIRLWDVSVGREVKRFEGHTGTIFSVGFTPAGNQVLSGSSGYGKDREKMDNTMRLWDVATGKELRQMRGAMDNFLSVAICPGGVYAVSGHSDKSIWLWEIDTDREPKKFGSWFSAQHEKSVSTVSFSPDGKFIVSGSADGTILLWNSKTRRHIAKLVPKRRTGITSLDISPDGRYIVSAGIDGTVGLWEIETSQQYDRHFSGHKAIVNRVYFSPDGSRVLSASGSPVFDMMGPIRGKFEDCTIRLWDVKTGKQIKIFLIEGSMGGASTPVESVAFSPDGRYVLSGSMDGTVLLFSLEVDK
jgi:WD40 repeat protein